MAGALLDKAYNDTMEAKARGEKIGWATSLFPQEIAETLGLHIVYPENHGAAIAAKKLAAPFLEYAEAHDCNNDLCSYAKIDIAYADIFDCSPASNMAKPDFLLIGNNGCNEITKWFEVIGRKLEIPTFMIDFTYNHMPYVTDSRVQYIKAQIEQVIEALSAFTGTTWDPDRFAEIMRVSTENRNLWEQVADYLELQPSPLSGFDLFNYMGPMVFTRGRRETDEMKRIHYIVDTNFAGQEKSGFCIIREGQIQDYKIDGIIISSYKYKDEIKKNLKEHYPEVRYLDIYEELEKRGVVLSYEYFSQQHPYGHYSNINTWKRKFLEAKDILAPGISKYICPPVYPALNQIQQCYPPIGKPICRNQAISFMIADMATEIEAARELIYNTAVAKDAGARDAPMKCSMCKYYASEMVNRVAGKAVQIHGGYGFIKEYKVERLYRDARITTLYEGTSQVQQMVISGNLLR